MNGTREAFTNSVVVLIINPVTTNSYITTNINDKHKVECSSEN